MKHVRSILLAMLVGSVSAAAFAQGTQIALSGAETSPDEEVEITSDTLNVNRDTGEAIFIGSVVVVQGALKLIADEMTVLYEEETPTRPAGVAKVTATGNVFFATGEDAAESQRATYLPDQQELRMSGSVLLKQGPIVVEGDSLFLDLATGQGQMEGRVRTVLQPDAQ